MTLKTVMLMSFVSHNIAHTYTCRTPSVDYKPAAATTTTATIPPLEDCQNVRLGEGWSWPV
jgi:hypothetical protein